MKKAFCHPITITVFAILIIVIFALCGFRITYNPSLDNNWEAISACAGWAAVIVSGLAIYYAIQVPKKIAKEQNRIALFEKWFNIFQFYEKCISFSNALKRAETLEEMQKSCNFSFEIKCEQTDFNEMMLLLEKFEYTAHQLHFLFPGIIDEDANSLYLALYHFILQMVEVDKVVVRDISGAKNTYNSEMDNFKKKYEKIIFEQLEISNNN